MDKKLQASCRHDLMIQQRKPNGISASLSKCSPRPQGSGLKRNSLSKSLHNFFHRRHTYSLKQRHVKKGKKLFESINDADGNVEYIPLRRSSKARVWSVRNSFSKSPVETVPHELLKVRPHAEVERKNRCRRTCSYAFDVLNAFNGLSLASEENLLVKQSKFQDGLKCVDDQTNVKTQCNIEDNNDNIGSFDETQDRSRLSSFGSSVCYSDTSGCSVSSCSYCNQDRSDNDSVPTETDVSTSYWDLRLPTEAPSFRWPGLNPRRYSLSVLSEQQDVFGSPEMRMYLAKRRSSEHPCVYSGLNRSNQFMTWQDKFLHVLDNEKHSSERDNDFSAAVNEGEFNDKERNTTGIDIPKVHEINQGRRSMSMYGEVRRSKSINRTHGSDKERCQDKRHLQRSKSVDSSFKRSLTLREKQTSGNSWSCQFAFSDIDSSEDSESSPDPKESSSEDRQPSSCNETSSLSACSMSGSSVNERSTPKMSTRKKVNSRTSYIEDESLNDTDNIYMDLTENSHVSTSEKIAENNTKQTGACTETSKEFSCKVHEDVKDCNHEEQEEIKEFINEEQKVKECQNEVQERVEECQNMLQEDKVECQNVEQGVEGCQVEVQEVEEFQNMLHEEDKKCKNEVQEGNKECQNEVQGVEECQNVFQEEYENCINGVQAVEEFQNMLHEDDKCKNEVQGVEECQNEVQEGVEECQNLLHEDDKNCQNEVQGLEGCHNEEFEECHKEVPEECEKGKKKETEEYKNDVQEIEECTNKAQDVEECKNKEQKVEECTNKVSKAKEYNSKVQDEVEECINEGKECNSEVQKVEEFIKEIHEKNSASSSDIKKAECSGKSAAREEEKFEKIEDFVTDNFVDVMNKSDSFHSNTDVDEVSPNIRSIFSKNEENRNSKVFAENLLQYDDFGTDVDTLFQGPYEQEDLCLDLLFPEKDAENRCDLSKTTVSEPLRAEQNYMMHLQVLEKGCGDREVCLPNKEDGTVAEMKADSRCDDDIITEINVCFDLESKNYRGIPDSTSFSDNVQSNDSGMEYVLNCFDLLLHDEPEIGKGHLKCDTSFESKSDHAEETLQSADESLEDENAGETQEDVTVSSKHFDGEPYEIKTCSVEEDCAASGLRKINEEEKNTEHVGDSSEKDKVFEMINESVQVRHSDEQNDSSEFGTKLLEEILITSGKKESSSDVVDIVDDVEGVFEAMNKEIDKEENKDKDMMVVFIVGGELKVIRRSGTLFNGSHGDSRQADIPSMTRKERPRENGDRDYVYKRSVHDINRGRPKSAIIVTRSQSFNGMANQQVMMGGRRENPHAIVLGESFRHHRGGPPVQAPRASPGSRGAVGFSFKKSPKVPKVPRPNRAVLMFQSVKRGVREFIDATKEDIDQLQHREMDLTSTAQGKLHETDKQIKSAERYLKRLEFHLAKLDELHEYYLLQQQLREGVRTMHRAYVTSPGNQAHSLTNVKYGYKECTQTMCNIEAQLEAMMGTFNCKLKGMAGFARLCPGDVFEVTVRHGTQKWKTKGRIEKTGNQKWDIPEFNFKAVVGDIFNIKGLEVRAFKSVLLGQKSCETKDLFSANPQLMTVSINVNGSLKLSIVITWNPLDGVEESFNFMEAPQRAQGTPRRRPVSVIALNGQYDVEPGADRQHPAPLTIQQTKDDNFILRSSPSTTHHANVTSYHGLDSPHVSARLSDHMPDAYRQTGPIYSQTSHHAQAGFHSSPALPVFGESDSDKQLPHPPTQNSAFSNSLPSVMGHLHFPSVAPHAVSNAKEDEENTVLNIEDVLHTLTSALEDYHGQYTELQKLEDLTKFAHKLIRKQFRNSSRSSSISVSIESALEAFDFLDTEEAFEEPRSPTDNIKASFDDMLCSPESTAKTGDSGIESLAQRLSEDTQLGSSLGSSPVPPSTGNEEVDQCLLYHLTYCERLLENLGAFGPLKCREIYALDKLQKQCTIIESLLKLAKSGPHIDLHSVMSSICEDKMMREFWVKCTDQNSLYIHPDRLLNMLEQKFSSVIAEKHMIDPVKVCQHVITRVLDIPDYESERGRSWFVLTLHQFMLYFNEEGGLKHIEDVAEEMKLVERLTSGNPDCVIKAILTLRDTLPSSPCLKVIGMLLVTMDKEVEQCTLSYLNLIQKKKENREKALITFVEGLEDRTPEIRSGACAALAILEATESLDQLVYLWQSDSSAMVQRCAKEALLALGDEGRKAFEDAQLSKHGFQGIQVHK